MEVSKSLYNAFSKWYTLHKWWTTNRFEIGHKGTQKMHWRELKKKKTRGKVNSVV